MRRTGHLLCPCGHELVLVMHAPSNADGIDAARACLANITSGVGDEHHFGAVKLTRRGFARPSTAQEVGNCRGLARLRIAGINSDEMLVDATAA